MTNLTRREFLKTTLATFAASLLPSFLSGCTIPTYIVGVFPTTFPIELVENNPNTWIELERGKIIVKEVPVDGSVRVGK